MGNNVCCARAVATDTYPKTLPNCMCVLRLVAIATSVTYDPRQSYGSGCRLTWKEALHTPLDFLVDVGGPEKFTWLEP